MRIETKISRLRIEACTLDPRLGTSLLAADLDLNDRANYVLCRCIAGGLRIGDGIARLTIVNSIVDQSGSFAIAGLVGAGSPPGPIPTSPPPSSPPRVALPPAAPSLQLERVTVLGRIHCEVLIASETILDDIVVAEDHQSGCIRFSRYEAGSLLPRRFQCVPSEQEAAASRRVAAALRRCSIRAALAGLIMSNWRWPRLHKSFRPANSIRKSAPLPEP